MYAYIRIPSVILASLEIKPRVTLIILEYYIKAVLPDPII